MRDKIGPKTSIEDFAGLVCAELNRDGMSCVLGGGAVVSIYSNNEYQSWDLDFILLGLGKKVDGVMLRLGFKKDHGRHWVHPKTKIYVEFPGSTVMIGESLDTEVVERKTKYGILKLLSPTDCVKDRLCSYYHWNDPQCLNQAVSVALKQPLNFSKVAKWSKEEGMSTKYEEFIKAYKKARDLKSHKNKFAAPSS